MTALAASRFGLPITVAPVRANPVTKRASIDWTEPEPWIVAVLLVTGVAVIGRHPLARAIGTEADDTTMTPSVVATAPPAAVPTTAARAAVAAPVPTHEPRNPFKALIDASGALVAPALAGAAASVGTTITTHPTPDAVATTPHAKPAAAAAAGSATCAGTVHTVVAGDSLWSLAATMVKSNDTGKINVVWHRIYEANTPPLGPNPSLLPVGTKLCLPSKA